MTFDLERFLPYRLFQAAEHTSRAFYLMYRDEYGLTRTEWRVLFNIGQYGPISASDIARRSGLEKPKISRAVLRLEDKAWIERIFSRDNRRSHQLKLTRLGEQSVEKLRLLAADFDAEIQATLDRRSLTELILLLQAIEEIEFQGDK